jgi:cyclopropane-fatty-acyl-phospholipid synthase
VFPGGYIPAMSELVTPLEQSGWEIGDIEVLRRHYALTIEEWYRRTIQHKDRIVELYDERMFRMWQFYLAGAEQGFRTGPLVNFHLQTVKQRSALPMTRDYIQQETARLSALDEAPAWHLAPSECEAAE